MNHTINKEIVNKITIGLITERIVKNQFKRIQYDIHKRMFIITSNVVTELYDYSYTTKCRGKAVAIEVYNRIPL
jgi:hypothetical protein